MIRASLENLPMKKDYFAVLGLKPSASDKEIRSAYKKLAKKYHPDLNPGDRRAEERFKEISEAHEVLTDPEKRRKWESGDFDYESFFRNARGGRGAYGGAGAAGPDLGSIFEEIFGGQAAGMGMRGNAAGPARGADLQFETSIGFEDAVKGTTLRIPLAHTVSCSTCAGHGFVQKGNPRPCARCQGSGRVSMGGGILGMAAPCPECGGTGRSPGDPCADCGGTGAKRATETIQVRIPPGMDDGAKVRVAGKGEAGTRGGPAGDLYVVLKVQPHRFFRREGRDIVLDLPLTVAEAALGTRLEVPTLDGRVTLTVPAGSRSGQRLRLRGRGTPSARGRAAGDQIAVIQIVTPKKLDARSKEILEELQRLDREEPRADLGW